MGHKLSHKLTIVEYTNTLINITKSFHLNNIMPNTTSLAPSPCLFHLKELEFPLKKTFQ